jgi:hypothetical protein
MIGLMMPLCSLFLLLPVTVTRTAISYLRVVNIFCFKARWGYFEVIPGSLASPETTAVQKLSTTNQALSLATK